MTQALAKVLELSKQSDDKEVQAMRQFGETIVKIADELAKLDSPQDRKRVLRAAAALHGVILQ